MVSPHRSRVTADADNPDCVSFKPNSTQVIVQNLDCTGSHGISVGSLGQYQGETDIVEDVYVYNVTMRDASDLARIKVWPGVPPESAGSTSGGGLGRVRNVTWDTMYSENNDWVIQLTQCYYAINQTMCDRYPVGGWPRMLSSTADPCLGFS